MSDKGLRIVTATAKEVAEVKCEQFYHFRAETVNLLQLVCRSSWRGRLWLGGVPRCMGRSDGKRNAPCGFQTPCSPFRGLRRSGGTGRGAVRRRRQAASLSRCCGCGYGLAGLSRQTKYRWSFPAS